MPSQPKKLLSSYSQEARSNPIAFAREMLGLPLHEGQRRWIEESSSRKISILRPGNRWGKTFVEAVVHIWHCMTKPNLFDTAQDPKSWLSRTYETLNFGPGYEQAREIPRMVVDICEGNVAMPKELWDEWGKTNNSQLKGWAIAKDGTERQSLPFVEFMTGSRLLIRSYSEMGAAFKGKALAHISGDECADIAELWTFTNVTLLPRLVSMKGRLTFVGTIQPGAYDYLKMIEMAEEDMREGRKNFYVQKGSMYDNEFLDKDEIRMTEEIADERIRKQIIDGEYVEAGQTYLSYKQVRNGLDRGMKMIESGLPGRDYLTSVDFSGGQQKWADYTIIQVWDYTEEPYRMVYHWKCKGDEVSIPMQYQVVRDVKGRFPGKVIIDGTSLGGKNAKAFLRDVKPVVAEIQTKTKGEMLQSLKHAFDGGQSKELRRKLIERDGELVDVNPHWGLIRYPEIPDLIEELLNYKLDDKKIKQDNVMTMAQAIWWIELRRPKMTKKGMVAVDWII